MSKKMEFQEKLSNKNFHFYCVKDIRKDVPILQVWGSTPASPTPPVFRVILLHTEASGERFFRGSVYYCIKICVTPEKIFSLKVTSNRGWTVIYHATPLYFSKMREIVQCQFGQCGNQIGSQVRILISKLLNKMFLNSSFVRKSSGRSFRKSMA